MKNINTGVVALHISTKLKNSYFGKDSMNESEQLTSDFFSVIKNSPILELEYKVFNNIENKHIDNDIIASRYIDNNIKLFDVYTNEEINNERAKLHHLINGNSINYFQDKYKIKLYESINTLIYESLNDYNKINVDDLHEAFTFVLNHIKEPKTKNDDNLINEDVIKLAINKFNDKYSSLNEDESKILNILINGNDADKENLLENYKTETIKLLESQSNTNTNNSISKAIAKIKEMIYNNKTVNDNIVSLYELKKNIL